MNDPRALYPPKLREILTIFEEKGLDLACEKARLFPLSRNPSFLKGLPSDRALQGAWLWSCYFDAHWMSDSLEEFYTLQRRLLEHLETFGQIFHRNLLDKLYEIEAQTARIQKELLADKEPSADLDPWMRERIRAVKVWLTPERKNDFRLPIHKLLLSSKKREAKSALSPEPFWEVCLLEKAPPELDPFLVCSDLLTLAYAVNCSPNPLFFPAPIEALPFPKKFFFDFEQAFQKRPTHPLAAFWQRAEKSGDEERTLFLFSQEIRQKARAIRLAHYGAKAYLPLLYRYQNFDSQNDLLSLPLLPNPFERALAKIFQEGNKKRTVPKSVVKKLPRLLHVLSHLVDNEDPETELLGHILALRNPNRLDQAVIVTESGIPRKGDYPLALGRSALSNKERGLSSETTGAHFLKFLDKERLAYLVERPEESGSESLEDLADHLAQRLNNLDPDAILFYGPEPLHHALASRLPTRCNLLFDPEEQLRARGFHRLFSPFERNAENKEPARFGTRVDVLPMLACSRANWKEEPPQKRALGLSEELRIATTICKRKRLSFSFCKAVSEILRRVPDLLYLPLEERRSFASRSDSSYREESIRNRFDDDIRSRVRFLDLPDTPANLIRCFDLYLDPFPLGSLYGTLDGLASGLPLVTLYQEKAPFESRCAGLLLGKEKRLCAKTTEEYVEKAIFLMENRLAYFQASQISFQNYDWRTNSWAYVESFEQKVLEAIANRR